MLRMKICDFVNWWRAIPFNSIQLIFLFYFLFALTLSIKIQGGSYYLIPFSFELRQKQHIDMWTYERGKKASYCSVSVKMAVVCGECVHMYNWFSAHHFMADFLNQNNKCSLITWFLFGTKFTNWNEGGKTNESKQKDEINYVHESHCCVDDHNIGYEELVLARQHHRVTFNAMKVSLCRWNIPI